MSSDNHFILLAGRELDAHARRLLKDKCGSDALDLLPLPAIRLRDLARAARVWSR